MLTVCSKTSSNMQEGQIKTAKGTWNYLKWGQGEQLLFALHGFARKASSFQALGEAFAAHFTIIAPDLPFHGKTAWKDSFDANDLHAFITQTLKMEQKESYSLLGYSLGGRLALGSLPLLKDRIVQLYLAAPDGLDTAYGFWVERMPLSWKRFLYKSLKNPAWLLRLARTVNCLWLIDRWTLLYLERQLGDAKRKERLFKTWYYLSNFSFSLKEVKKTIQEMDTLIHFYWGKHDQILKGKKVSITL